MTGCVGKGGPFQRERSDPTPYEAPARGSNVNDDSSEIYRLLAENKRLRAQLRDAEIGLAMMIAENQHHRNERVKQFETEPTD